MSETPAFHPFYSHIRTPLAMQFAWSVHVIREAIGRFCQFRTHHTAAMAILALASWRLGRALNGIDALMVRWKAGTLPKPRPSRAGQPREPVPEGGEEARIRRIRPWAPDGGPAPRLSRARGWLLRMVQPTAQGIPAFERMIDDPEFRALLQDAPQAGRLVRPIAGWFAISRPWLDLPRRTRAPRPKREPNPASRPRDARDTPGPYQVPRKWRLQIPKRSWDGGESGWEKSG